LDIWQIIILALIQGITEFLPISSSAHLVLFPQLTGIADQGVAFDVALHVGSLVAVIWYFRHDIIPLLSAWFRSFKSWELTPASRLVWGTGIGTIPVALVGLAVTVTDVEDSLRTVLVIAIANLVFAALLWFADATGRRERDEYSLTWSDIFWIGLAQALAVIPGTSRSGITITAALLLGLNRRAAARFSFLLSIPVIILAGGGEAAKLVLEHAVEVNWFALFLGASCAGISAYFCIHLFISLLERIGMLPFVLYRLVLGVLLLLWMV